MISDHISDHTATVIFLQSRLKLEHCKLHKAAQRRTCYIINDAKLCGKFMTLHNQTSRYKSKCIRIAGVISLT